MVELQLISKILDEGSVIDLNRYGVSAIDFPTQSKVFNYIMEYNTNHDGLPDYRTIVADFEGFEYQANVNEPMKGIITRLKQDTAKRKSYELLQTEAAQKFQSMTGDKFAAWLKSEADKIVQLTSTDFSVGTNFATNGEDREADYFARKSKKNLQYVPYPYPTLNKHLGGMELGDYILLTAFTNRGKSWIGSHMGQHAWRNGFDVLHYSPELSKNQQETRIETLDGHFNNSELKRGELTTEESNYIKYLGDFKPGVHDASYIIKTMEDLPGGLTPEVIEADLALYPDTKFVIIDGFNLMVHRGKDGNRNAMTNTSRNLRQLFGRYGVAGLVIHQVGGAAEKENKEEDEAGLRIVKPPSLEQYSETISVIQDAATVLTFDACDGIGKVAIRKAREPGVGEVVDLICNFNLGYIQEPKPSDMF